MTYQYTTVAVPDCVKCGLPLFYAQNYINNRGPYCERCINTVEVRFDLAAAWPTLEDIPDNETLSRLVCDAVIDWTLDEQGVDFSPLPREGA